MLSDSTSKVFVNLPSRTNVYSSWAIANALRLIWILIILLGELGSVYWSLARCRWPSIRNSMPVGLYPSWFTPERPSNLCCDREANQLVSFLFLILKYRHDLRPHILGCYFHFDVLSSTLPSASTGTSHCILILTLLYFWETCWRMGRGPTAVKSGLFSHMVS